MATQNYGSKSLAVLDKPFLTESKTDEIINKGVKLTFEGVKTVTIYVPQTVAEVDYVREGRDRFGPLIELPNGIQEFQMTQDKAATWTIDKGNYNDSMMAINADDSMAFQIAKIAVPNTDKYRFATLFGYAVTRSQGTTFVTSASNAYATLLADQAELDDAEVNEENRYVFVTSTFLNKLKLDPTFRKDCDTSYADAKKGIVGQVDGLTIKKLPRTYLPANASYLITHRDVLIAPVKMKTAKIHTDVQGIDGWVMEYRRYHDAFITTAKGVAIRYHKEA